MSDDKSSEYIITDRELFTIKKKDHFYISVHGVTGIRLRVDSATINRLELKTKLLQLADGINKCL